MPRQSFLSLRMRCMTLTNLLQAIPHQHLIVASCEYRGWYIHQDCDPTVLFVGEGLTTEEDGGYNTGAKVTGHIGADGDVSKTPNHNPICQADNEGDGSRRNEGVRGIESSPNYDSLGRGR